MIFLSGAIRTTSQQELLREGEVYAERGWELKDPTTHSVAITIDEGDIDALAAYLHQRPRDKRLKTWTDRSGQQHQTRTVTLYLKGTEMAGNWVRLRAALSLPSEQQPVAGASHAPARQRPEPPVRRSNQQPVAQSTPATQAPDAPMAWASGAATQPASDDGSDELPF